VRDIQELLREKELAIERVRREVEALRSLGPWLSESGVFIPRSRSPREGGTDTDNAIGTALRTAGPLLVEEYGVSPEIRARLAEAAENELSLSRASRISRQLRRIAAPLLGPP